MNSPQKSLRFCTKQITDSDLSQILSSVDGSLLSSLNLWDNCISRTGTEQLVEFLKKNTTIKALNLGSNKLGNEGLKILTDSLQQVSFLASLNLSNNLIDDCGAKVLAEYLKLNTTLISLDLSNNKIGSQGGIDLAASLETNSKLTFLDLFGNALGDTAGVSFAASLSKNSSLTSLDVGNTQITDLVVQEFAKTLQKNQALRSLHLHYNNITDAGVSQLAKSLIVNSSLTALNLKFNQITNEGVRDLEASLQKNKTVISLELAQNKKLDESAKEYAQLLASIDSNAQRSAQVLKAVKAGKKEDTLKLLDEGASIYTQDVKGNSLLHLAVLSNSLELVQEFVNPNSKYYAKTLNHANTANQTPLMIAQSLNHSEIISLLQTPVLLEQTRSWHFDFRIKEGITNRSLVLVDAGPQDEQKVKNIYRRFPVPNMEIKKVKIIYNPELNRMFQSQLKILQERYSNPKFVPNLDQEYEAPWRKQVLAYLEQLVDRYKDPSFPNVKILPCWHGTNTQTRSGIYASGYAALGSTDAGYFGKGIYSSVEPEYSFRVYNKREETLILNWVAFYSAYPVIDSDHLTEKNNYKNFDAHFIPVVPQNPQDPNETVYNACQPRGTATYHEIVVFQTGQCLPRYEVTLGPIT